MFLTRNAMNKVGEIRKRQWNKNMWPSRVVTAEML